MKLEFGITGRGVHDVADHVIRPAGPSVEIRPGSKDQRPLATTTDGWVPLNVFIGISTRGPRVVEGAS